MANYTTYSDFYKVSFITTKSINIPKLLKQTGGLIVMSNTDDFKCTVNPDHGSHHPKSLWFRGEMIASGYGALCEQERNNLTYLAGAYDVIFGGIDKGFTDLSFWVNSYYGEFQDPSLQQWNNYNNPRIPWGRYSCCLRNACRAT